MKFTGFVILRDLLGFPIHKVPVYKRIHRKVVR